jgi:NitT/TauT family transport system permease protein/taurine transport system permease protein
LLIVLLAWEIGAYLAGDPLSLPTVQDTARTFVTYLDRPYPTQGYTLIQNTLISSARVGGGFAIGTLGGILLATGMAGLRPVRELLDPVLQVIRPLPPLAFIPLFVIWFGIGETPKVVLIVLGVTPVVALTTLGALDRVPLELLNASRSLGASHWYTMLHVRLRHAAPAVVTGMRVALGGAWTSIIAAEMIGSAGGVGFLTLQAGNYLQTPLVFSGIAAIALLGLVFDAALRLLLRLADPARYARPARGRGHNH